MVMSGCQGMLHTAYCLGLMDITLVSDVRYGDCLQFDAGR